MSRAALNLQSTKKKEKKSQGRIKKRPFFVAFYYLVVPWESEIFGSIFYVVVDAIGLETDFTLKTNRKRVKEKLLKRT